MVRFLVSPWRKITMCLGTIAVGGDLSNAQILIEKTDGPLQFFVDAGTYSFPDLGTPYTRSNKITSSSFGAVPIAFLKWVPTGAFSVQVGKLPTLIGAEYNYTFENTNIERGLLWNQENQVARGIQANYTYGPVLFNLSLNDGFYSGKYSYVTGAATWTIDGSNTLELSGGGNTKTTTVSNSATPVFLNNSSMINLIWTHTQGPWTFQPYYQYTSVPSVPALKSSGASTSGAAVFIDYAFPSTSPLTGFSLPVRVEYITSKSNAASSPNLLYGPSSKAWSFTFTPTYQWKIYFVRGELSYTNASSLTAGDGFGTLGTAKSQTRALLETGVLF